MSETFFSTLSSLEKGCWFKRFRLALVKNPRQNKSETEFVVYIAFGDVEVADWLKEPIARTWHVTDYCEICRE